MRSYPEAAMEARIDLALAGPRIYAGVENRDAIMGRGRRAATAADIRRALACSGAPRLADRALRGRRRVFIAPGEDTLDIDMGRDVRRQAVSVLSTRAS